MNTDIMRAFLAVASIALVAAILWMLATGMLDADLEKLAYMVFGVIIATFKDVYGYFFGSSDGSKRKTELAAKLEGINDA